MGEVRVSFRLAGVSFAVVGAWFLALVPLHPDILSHDVARLVRDTNTWQLSHAAMFLSGAALLWWAWILWAAKPAPSREPLAT